jgi:maltooligosyltrehalose synthase
MQHALERQADTMEHADLGVISDIACNHLGMPAEGAQTLTEVLFVSRHAPRT